MTEQKPDRRKPGWFWIRNELIEKYGPSIGANGIAVYAVLCKYAIVTQAARSTMGVLRLAVTP